MKFSQPFPWRRILRPILILVIALGLFLWGVTALSAQAQAESLRTTREGIRRAAVQCYAIEGRYPTTLAYLETHYGIAPDPDKYLVYYTYLAPNLMPDITVLALNP